MPPGMSKLQLLAVVAVMAVTAARAQPAPAVSLLPPGNHEPDRQLAAEFADALTLSPAHPHVVRFASLIQFQEGSARVYSTDREKLMALASAWREHGRWTTITVEGYGSNESLAQRRADKIRSYLTRYGIPAELVVAIGRDPVIDTMAAGASGGHIDLTIALCDPNFGDCRLPGRQRSAQIAI